MRCSCPRCSGTTVELGSRPCAIASSRSSTTAEQGRGEQGSQLNAAASLAPMLLVQDAMQGVKCSMDSSLYTVARRLLMTGKWVCLKV